MIWFLRFIGLILFVGCSAMLIVPFIYDGLPNSVDAAIACILYSMLMLSGAGGGVVMMSTRDN